MTNEEPRYRALPLRNHPVYHWTVVLPDGTDHAHTATLRAALRIIEQLKREQRQHARRARP